MFNERCTEASLDELFGDFRDATSYAALWRNGKRYSGVAL